MTQRTAEPERLLALMRRLRPQVRGELGWVAGVVPVARLQPTDALDVAAALAIADDERVPVAFGQVPVSAARRAPAGLLLIDDAGLADIPDLDPARRLVGAGPGATTAALNRQLEIHGLWLPVLAAGAVQTRLGALAGLDAGGLGAATMADRLLGIDAVLPDGTQQLFGPFGEASSIRLGSGRAGQLVSALFGIANDCQADIARHWPAGRRAVGGYLLDCFHPRPQRPYTADGTVNLAHLLAGSCGQLAWFSRLHLRPVPRPAVMRWALVGFASVAAALARLREALAAQPAVLQLLDAAGMGALRASQMADDQALWGTLMRADGAGQGRVASSLGSGSLAADRYGHAVTAGVPPGTGMSPGTGRPASAGATGCRDDAGLPAAGWLVGCTGETEAEVQARLRSLLEAAGVAGAGQRAGVLLAGEGAVTGDRAASPQTGGLVSRLRKAGASEPARGAAQSAHAVYPVWQQLLDVETAPRCWALAHYASDGGLDVDALRADGATPADGLLLPPMPLPALAARVGAVTETLRSQGGAVHWRGRLLTGELIVHVQPGGAMPAQRAWQALLQTLAPLVAGRWSPALQAAFAQVKAQFDPHGILPGA
ncbi:MAG: FAD-binding protein [Lautropia sp.]|nr:FAD-binding protein [Lautropia sp.]